MWELVANKRNILRFHVSDQMPWQISGGGCAKKNKSKYEHELRCFFSFDLK